MQPWIEARVPARLASIPAPHAPEIKRQSSRSWLGEPIVAEPRGNRRSLGAPPTIGSKFR